MFGLIYFQPNIFLPETSLDIGYERLNRSERRKRNMKFGQTAKDKSQRQLRNRHNSRYHKGGHNKDRYHK